MWVELLGIIATCFLVLGYSQKSEKNLRAINNVGTLLFIVYGVLIGSFSVVVLNIAILIINSLRIIKIRRKNNVGFRNSNKTRRV